jgi:hypothetical protein
MVTAGMRMGAIHVVETGSESLFATPNPRAANKNPKRMAPLSPSKIFAG